MLLLYYLLLVSTLLWTILMQWDDGRPLGSWQIPNTNLVINGRIILGYATKRPINNRCSLRNIYNTISFYISKQTTIGSVATLKWSWVTTPSITCYVDALL